MWRTCSGEWPRTPYRLADRRRFRLSNVLKTENSLPFEATCAAFHRRRLLFLGGVGRILGDRRRASYAMAARTGSASPEIQDLYQD